MNSELKYVENIEWILQNGTSFELQQVIDNNFNYLVNDAKFISKIRKTTFNFAECLVLNDNKPIEYNKVPEFVVSNDKILILSSFIYKVWSLQEKKEYDENVKWLIHNCDEETFIKMIDLNRHNWFLNYDFINDLKERWLNIKYYINEEFILNVYLESEKFKYIEDIKWLLINDKLDSIKKELISKFGYSDVVLYKIYTALSPLKKNININYIPQSPSKIKLIRDIKHITSYKFINLFIKELEVPENSLKRRSSIKKKTHAATDLANFVFCPASYAISQTYNIDFREQENVFIGTQEHERQRLLSLSDRKKIQDYKYRIGFENYYQDFNRIINATCISQGHNDKKPITYYSKKKKLSGIPDYIFQDCNGSFAVEEKYTLKKYDELTDLYNNHKIQALVYLYGLDEFQFKEVFVLYWFIKKGDNEDYQVYNYRFFRLDRTKENEKMILGVFNKIESIQNREEIEFPVNNLNYTKCVKCNYFPYCEYKKGGNSIIKLEPLDSSITIEDIDLNV